MLASDFVSMAAGLLGALCYILNYTRLTLRPATADDPGYFALNIVAATLVLCSLVSAFNPAALIIQLFFLTMSVAGLASRLRRRGTRHGR